MEERASGQYGQDDTKFQAFQARMRAGLTGKWWPPWLAISYGMRGPQCLTIAPPDR